MRAAICIFLYFNLMPNFIKKNKKQEEKALLTSQTGDKLHCVH